MRIMFLALAALCFTVTSAFSAQEKDWTFLLFLNGKNNLDTFGDLNMNQMEKVGSNEKINMVVEWGTMRRDSVDRLLVRKDNDFNRVTSPVVERLGAVDMGSHESLENFILWGMEKYPAKHYFVAVWNHGSGWHAVLDGKRGTNIRPNDISFDDRTGNAITTEQLGDVMRRVHARTGKKIDIYGSDACLMAMAEVAGEMNGAVDYFLGSQDLEPGAGWPYYEIMERWSSLPYASPADVSKILTEEYVKSYQGGSNGSEDVTFSAFKMSAYPEFAAAVADLSGSLVNASSVDKKTISEAVADAFSFAYSDYGDLGDFLSLLNKSKAATPQMADAIARTQNAMNDFVLINRVTPSFARATGVAFWLPKYSYQWQSYAERYSELRFNKDTQWGLAVEEYLK